MILGLLIGCASSSSSRKPASEGKCVVVQHSDNEWFRVELDGKPAYPSWYTQEQVDRHLVILNSKGECD